MHEWALAEGVIETARKMADKREAGSAFSVRVHIGQLQQIETEIFRFAMDELVVESDAVVKSTKFEIVIDPTTLECRNCEHVWPLADGLNGLGEEEAEAIHFVPELAGAYVRCPSCGSPDFRVRDGRGVAVEFVEGN